MTILSSTNNKLSALFGEPSCFDVVQQISDTELVEVLQKVYSLLLHEVERADSNEDNRSVMASNMLDLLHIFILDLGGVPP